MNSIHPPTLAGFPVLFQERACAEGRVNERSFGAIPRTRGAAAVNSRGTDELNAANTVVQFTQDFAPDRVEPQSRPVTSLTCLTRQGDAAGRHIGDVQEWIVRMIPVLSYRR